MEEKRHHKRLKIDVSIQLERLTEDGTTTYDYTQVEVTDVSRGGIGFFVQRTFGSWGIL